MYPSLPLLSHKPLRVRPRGSWSSRKMTLEKATEVQFLYKWSSEDTAAFITACVENEVEFTRHKNSAVNGWKKVLQNVGLDDKVSPQQARKKWDNLKKIYKKLKNPPQVLGWTRERIQLHHGPGSP